jgi:hypothetical protein
LALDASPSPKGELPAWRKAFRAAKEAALAEMPPEELTEYEAAQKAARVRAQHRRTIAAELTQRVVALLFDGMTGHEVAKAVGRPARSLVQFAASRGVFVSLSVLTVQRAVKLTMEREQALRKMAAEYGKTPAETLGELLAFALDDDAAIARRVLHVKRRAA